MAVLLAVVLVVVLLLPVEMLPLPTPSPEGGAPAADLDHRAGPGSLAVEGGLLSEELVRSRLDALERELARLDRDPDVFAKAFHTSVARSAYQALQADAAAFAEQPWWQLGETLSVEFLDPGAGVREVLEF